MSPQSGTNWTVIASTTLYHIFMWRFRSPSRGSHVERVDWSARIVSTWQNLPGQVFALQTWSRAFSPLRLQEQKRVSASSSLFYLFQEVLLAGSTVPPSFTNNSFYSHFPNLNNFSLFPYNRFLFCTIPPSQQRDLILHELN